MTLRWGTLAAIALFLLPQVEAVAGAWNLPRGATYFKVSFSGFVAENEFDADGNVLPFDFEGRYRDRNLVLYGEHGLSDGVALIGSIPLMSIEYENLFEAGETDGLGDFDLGVRVGVAERAAVLSFQGIVKVPGQYEGEPRLPLGNDQYDVEGRFLVGQSLLRGRLYYGVEAGYRWREREPSDEWRYKLELGGSITRRLCARAKLDGIVSARNADDVRDVFGNPVLRYEAELQRVEVSAGYAAGNNPTVEVSWAPIFAGRNTAKGTTWSAAVIWVWPSGGARRATERPPGERLHGDAFGERAQTPDARRYAAGDPRRGPGASILRGIR